MIPQGEQADFELRHSDLVTPEEFEDDKWGELLNVYAEVDGDPRWTYLRHPGIRLVQGDGQGSAEEARIFICGEAPGAVENGAGKPFMGPSGRVLDSLLSVAGLRRDQCFITNVLKYRPAGNATPGVGEAFMAREALRKEWKIINPALTIAVGAVAHKLLNPAEIALMNFPHGELWTYPGREDGRYVTSVFHPAFAMRYPRYRDPMEESWARIGADIDRLGLRSEL